MEDETIASDESSFEEAGEEQLLEETQPEQPVSRKYKVKVDDQESEVDEDELLRGYQNSKASSKRYQEASHMQKQLEQFIESSRKDPRKMFEVLGINPRDFSEQLLLQELEESLLSPEEKSSRSERQELEQYRLQSKLLKDKEASTQREAEYSRVAEDIDSQIYSILKESGTQATPRNIARIAEYMLAGLDAKDGVMDARTAYGKVRSDVSQDLQELFAQSSTEELVKILPVEFLQSLRQHDIGKARSINLPQSIRPGSKPQAEAKEGKSKYRSIDDLLK